MITKKIGLLLFLPIALAIFILPRIPFNGNLSTIKLVSEKELAELELLDANFSQEKNLTFLLLEHESSFNNPEAFKVIEQITHRLTNLSQVESVISITNLKLLKLDYKNLNGSQLNKYLSKQINSIRKKKDIYHKFISPNGKHALIYITVKPKTKLDLQSKIKKWPELKKPISSYIFAPNHSRVVENIFYSETSFLALVSLISVICIFYLFIGSWKGILFSLLFIFFNFSTTIIFIWLFNFKLTIHLIPLPGLIIVFTLSDILHILYQHSQLRDNNLSSKNIRKRITHKLSKPILFTSISNAFAYIIFLVFTDHQSIFELTTITLISILLSFLSSRFIAIKIFNPSTVYIKTQRISRIQNWKILNKVQIKNSKKSLVFTAILAFLLFFVAQRKVQINDNNFLESNTSELKAQQILSNSFFGHYTGHIQISINEDDSIWKLNHLKEIEIVERMINQIFVPKYLTSPVLNAKRVHRYRLGQKNEAFKLPNFDTNSWKSYLVKYHKQFGSQDVVSENNNTYRLIFGFNEPTLEQRLEKYKNLEKQLKRISKDDIKFKLLSTDYLSDLSTVRLTNQLMKAWSLSAILTGILIIFVLKSVMSGFAFILTNLIPLLLAVTCMNYLNLPFNPQSLFFLALLSGICIDDSIFIMFSRAKSRKEIEFYPILTTSAVLAAGLFCFAFSNFDWLRPFFWVFLTGIASALVLDILFLPSFKKIALK